MRVDQQLLIRQFLALERSLHHKGHFSEFSAAIQEYFDMGHAEEVPLSAMDKLPRSVDYLPMHAVRKDSSTTTKLRVVLMLLPSRHPVCH